MRIITFVALNLEQQRTYLSLRGRERKKSRKREGPHTQKSHLRNWRRTQRKRARYRYSSPPTDNSPLGAKHYRQHPRDFCACVLGVISVRQPWVYPLLRIGGVFYHISREQTVELSFERLEIVSTTT